MLICPLKQGMDMAVAATGKNHIDSLIKYYSWTGNSGAATTIAYNFAYAQQSHDDVGVPQSMEGSFVAAMQEWGNVANVKFTLNTVGATPMARGISFAQGDLGTGTLGLTVTKAPVNDKIEKVALVIDDRFTSASSVAKGSLGYFTLVHEIGHALGLEHPGPYAGSEFSPHLPTGEDNIQNTVMSYYNGSVVNENVNAPQGPMIYDIAAIQYLYGANRSYNAGNTVYNLTGANSVRTVWDGAGTDTILTTVNYSTIIDLREGIDYYSKVGNTLLWNAFGTNIENASGGSSADQIIGNLLGNALSGNNGNDTIYGNGGADVLNGHIGNDSLIGGSGIDTVVGAEGNDTIYGDNLAEYLTGSNDALNGKAGNDMIYGGGGNDTIYGMEDQDMLNGNAGNDVLYGGAGIDTVVGAEGNDIIYGDNPSEFLTGAADALNGKAGNDIVYGGGGNDTIWGEADNDLLNGNAGNDSVVGGAGIDTIVGAEGNDTLWGDNYAEYVTGDNDVLNGKQGNDTIFGGGGNDTVYGMEDRDYINGNAGNDALYGGTGNDALYGEAGSDTLLGEAGADSLFGGDDNDSLNGGADNDQLNGQAGADTIVGDAGADVIYGGDGGDLIAGNIGNDVIYGDQVLAAGGDGWDTIYGGDGNDTIYGNGGNDVIYGDAGSDVLFTGAGLDVMVGGADNDLFCFSGGITGMTSINDFQNAGAAAGDLIIINVQLLNGTGYSTEAQLAAAVVYGGGNASLTLASGFTITLAGVSSGLTADDFLID